MKKFIAIILVITMALSLTACMDKSSVVTPEKHRVYAGVFWYDFSDEFLSTVREQMNTKFDSLGIKYTNYDASNNDIEQISQIGEAIANGVNVLIINIVDTTSDEMAQSIIDIAKSVDIPVIFFNREVSNSIINSYKNACYVGVRAEDAGKTQGQMAGDYIVANYDAIDLNNDGKISYIMTKGKLDNQEAEARAKYSVEFCNTKLTEADKPELVYYETTNTDSLYPINQSTAFDTLSIALSTNNMDNSTPIEAVFANNYDAALDCIKALNNAGWNTGDGKSLPVFGIDYTLDVMEAIKAEKMTGSVFQSASGLANTVVALAQNTANDKNIFDSANRMFNMDDDCAKIRVPYDIITVENAEHPDFSNYLELPSDIEAPSVSESTNLSSDSESSKLPSSSESSKPTSDSKSSKLPSSSGSSNPSSSSISSNPSSSSGSSNPSSNSGSSNPSDTPSSPNNPSPVKFEAAVFWYSFSDAYLSTVRSALDDELTKAGINYTNYDAQNYQSRQNDQIDKAISQGVDLLIVNIVDTWDSSAAELIVTKAKAANIPIIFFNREMDDSVVNSYKNACFVGVNPAEAGEKQGEMAGDYITANYNAIDLNKDGKISYIMMKGELGNPEAEFRTENAVKFCNAKLTKAGKPKLVYYDSNNYDKFQPSNWSMSQAFNLMETALSTNPMSGKKPIEVVFANNDDAALGCIKALNNAGWNKGTGKSIPVFGIDYTYDAKDAIDAGKMTGSVLMPVEGMAETIGVLATNVANGKHVFANADNNFNVDDFSSKIRVPYEIKM